jgi:phosphohistidine phosphatase
MKQLTLIRHAKSSWASGHGTRDIDRPLNHRGERDAPRMATHLRQQGFLPDLMLSSPATRAATTAEEIARGIGYDVDNILWKDQIYAAMVSELLELITTVNAEISHVAMVGHNPAFTELANLLQPHPIDNIPTCGVVMIQFDVGDWSEIPQSLGNLLCFDTPKSLK